MSYPTHHDIVVISFIDLIYQKEQCKKEIKIANLDENNYTFEDIQNSLDKENKDTSINQNMTLDEPNSLVLDDNFRDFLLNEKNITEFESQFNSNSNENNKKLSVTDLVF